MSELKKEENNKIHKCPTEGASYESEQMKQLSKEMTDEIKNNIKLNKESIIFDFGAGTGLIGLNFINEVKHVIFEDVSSVMLDYLEYKCKKENIKNYTIFKGVMEDYNNDIKVDLITAGLVLHHIEDLQSLFKCFLKIMKPHSYLCLTDLKKDAPMFSLHTHHSHHMPHKGFVPEELCKELEKAGFTKTEIRPASDIKFTTKEGKDIISERFMIIAQGP